MAEKSEKVTTQSTAVAGAVAFLATATLNYAAVQNGYDPFAWCYGEAFIRRFHLEAWWSTAVFGLIVISFAVGMWRGPMKALPYLLTACLLIAIPEWLEQGFRLGGACH